MITELRKKAEIDYESYSGLLFKLIGQAISHYEAKYGEDGMKNIILMNKKDIVNKIYGQILHEDHFYVTQGMFIEEVVNVRKQNIAPVYSYSHIKKLYENPEEKELKNTLFTGIEKGVFDSMKVHSFPELIFARIIERDNNVKNWLRPAPTEFNITYNHGKKYEPDFVVETEDTIYLVEVKGEHLIEAADTIAKEERGKKYCKAATEYGEVNGYKKWEYLFIPAEKIQENSSFKIIAEKFKKE